MLSSRVGAVISALVAFLVADATLIGASLLNGANIYYRMTTELVQKIPSIQYYLPSEVTDENTESVLIVWEIWGQSFARVMAIQNRLLLLLDVEGSLTLGGAQVTSKVEQVYDAPDSAQPSYMRRIVESRLEIVRLRAA